LPTQPTNKSFSVNNLRFPSFHGMEEVIGSIPIRSTNYFNNLETPNRRKQNACVVVCVITRHTAAVVEVFIAVTLASMQTCE
jgi:hypothetical protein